MKKVFALSLLAVLIPLAAHAQPMMNNQSAFGATAYFRDPVDLGSLPSFSGTTIGDYAIGPEWRLNMSLLQLDVLGLVTPRNPVIVDGYLMGGLVLNLGILQLAGDVGPHLAYDGATQDLAARLGAKAAVDVVLGRVSVGVSYITDLSFSGGLHRLPDSGFLGVSLLFGW